MCSLSSLSSPSDRFDRILNCFSIPRPRWRIPLPLSQRWLAQTTEILLRSANLSRLPPSDSTCEDLRRPAESFPVAPERTSIELRLHGCLSCALPPPAICSNAFPTVFYLVCSCLAGTELIRRGLSLPYGRYLLPAIPSSLIYFRTEFITLHYQSENHRIFPASVCTVQSRANRSRPVGTTLRQTLQNWSFHANNDGH